MHAQSQVILFVISGLISISSYVFLFLSVAHTDLSIYLLLQIDIII